MNSTGPLSFDARSPARGLSLLAAFFASAWTGSAHAQNLLLNPSFEQNLTGWTVVSGSVATPNYGTADVPSTQVASWIGGGGKLLRDISANSAVEQVLNVGPLPVNTRVRASGYFGGLGAGEDRSRMVLRFLDASNGEISRENMAFVSASARNHETVLMRREALVEPPPGTERIAVRVELVDGQSFVSYATADHLSLELTSAPLTPAPLPMNTELLVNPSFDAGWSASSPLTLVDAQGWEGTSGSCVTKLYSDSDTSVPSTAVAAIVAGGPRLLAQSTASSGVKQRLDIRGNVALGAPLELRVSGYFGGSGGSNDRASVQVSFLDEFETPVGVLPGPIGPVDAVHRNYETVVLRRESRVSVPSSASFIDVQVNLAEGASFVATALADRVSAKLTAPSALQRLQLDTNAVRNGGFESGDRPGSPLQLNDPLSWEGVSGPGVVVLPYGMTGDTPSLTFASANQLGGACLRGIGSTVLAQRFSLKGYELATSQGRMFVDARAWLGGVGAVADDAELRFWFEDSNGVPIGLPEPLGPVTPADRGNATLLLLREASRQVPVGAQRLVVELRFRDLTSFQDRALADGIFVSLRDTAQPGVSYCTATENSSGAPALMSANGTASLAANNLVLRAGPVPSGAQGVMFRGLQPIQAPFNNGFICVTGSIVRFPVTTANANGVLVMPVDYSAWSGAPLTAGDTWRFQAWFRDPTAGGANLNLSDGYQLTFAP